MSISRRSAIKTITGSAAVVGAAGLGSIAAAGIEKPVSRPPDLKGNINHGVCRWPYGGLSIEELSRGARDIGIGGIDLVDEDDWPVLAEHDLICSMCWGPSGISRGFNRVENHDEFAEAFTELIPRVANAGYPNIICFSGDKAGLDDEEGIENCVQGIQRFISVAEEHRITICMEVLNAKVDHPDYHADNMPWTMEIVDRVGSDYFKILYDIYHMQIEEGDIIRTIRDHSDYIAHYHTGGVPGRNELDETQELYWPAIMRAIVETGFDGWVAQEFIPTRDPLTSLRESVETCDV